jgi:hypothetical protein
MVRKYINLRLNPDAYQVLQHARLTVARADRDGRLQRSAQLWALKALHACREAFRYDEKVNFHRLPENEQARLRRWRKQVEVELQRIAGM